MTKTINLSGTQYEVTFSDSGKVTKVMTSGKEIPVSINHPAVIKKFEEAYNNANS